MAKEQQGTSNLKKKKWESRDSLGTGREFNTEDKRKIKGITGYNRRNKGSERVGTIRKGRGW